MTIGSQTVFPKGIPVLMPSDTFPTSVFTVVFSRAFVATDAVF